jgi:hypothetical protein
MTFFSDTELTSEADILDFPTLVGKSEMAPSTPFGSAFKTDVVDIFQKCLAAAVEHSISNKIQKAHVAAATFSLDGTEIFSLSTCSAGNHAEISAVAAYYGRENSKKIRPQAGCCFKPRQCGRSLRELPFSGGGSLRELRGSPYPQAQLV